MGQSDEGQACVGRNSKNRESHILCLPRVIIGHKPICNPRGGQKCSVPDFANLMDVACSLVLNFICCRSGKYPFKSVFQKNCLLSS